MSVYLHMVPEEEVDYSKRGPGAYEALSSGKVPNTFRGLPVYTSYPLDTDFSGAPISLLDRSRQIGEWFYITPDDEAIAIFSATHDDFVPITYKQAMDACLNTGNQDGDGGEAKYDDADRARLLQERDDAIANLEGARVGALT